MFLAVDVGDTNGRVTAYRTLDKDSVLRHSSFPVSRHFSIDYGSLLRTILRMAGNKRIEGVGLAVAGKVSAKRTHLTGAGNLTHWVGQPVAEMLTRDLSCWVVLGNDAEAAAVAEALYGHGQSQGTDFWFIIWGPGIGGCLVRRLGDRAMPFPGEVGHQIISPDMLDAPTGVGIEECGCGLPGCLEALCSGAGIARLFGRPAEQLSPTQWEEVLERLTIGLYNTLTVQPTPLVVFGGGIAVKQSHLLPRLEHRLRGQCAIVEPPAVRLSAFGEGAGTLGALALLSMDE